MRRRLAAVDLDDVAGYTDDTLDEVATLVVGNRRNEHHDVAALRVAAEVIRHLAGQEQVLVVERTNHALAVDAYRLQGVGDDQVQDQRDQEHFERVPDPRAPARPLRRCDAGLGAGDLGHADRL